MINQVMVRKAQNLLRAQRSGRLPINTCVWQDWMDLENRDVRRLPSKEDEGSKM